MPGGTLADTYPTLEEAQGLATRGNLIPLYREVLADMETPVSVYRKIAKGPYSFLLESVEGGERLARYSFIGTEPRLTAILDDGVARVQPSGGAMTAQRFADPLDFVKELMSRYRPVPLPDLPRCSRRVRGSAPAATARACR